MGDMARQRSKHVDVHEMLVRNGFPVVALAGVPSDRSDIGGKQFFERFFVYGFMTAREGPLSGQL